MAAIASTNFAQPRTPVSAPTSGQGERVSSAGRASSGNALLSPRLKHVRNNQSNNGVSDILNLSAVSTPPTAATVKPPNSYVDVHQLLHEMDTHQQNLHERNHGIAMSNKSRESSPNQRRNYSPTSNNQYNFRAERDMLHDRCQQLQQQVRSLQLAYKESAMRRVQEEQSFREILRSERERFDRQMSRLQSKIDDRDTLLLEWVKAVYERNTAENSDGKGEFIPEIAQTTPQIKDLRNVFSFLTARTAVCVSAAKQYLTQDDIDRANAVSRDEVKRRRARSTKKNKKTPQKKRKNRSNEQPEVDDDGEEDNDVNGEDTGPIGAFRPQKQAKASTATSSVRKKVGGAARIRKASNNHNDTDDNSTVAGSIMDVDDLLQLQDDMDIRNYHRNHLTTDDDDDEDGNEEQGDAADGEDAIEGDEGDGTEKRRDSTNQSNAREEDSRRILQELVDALSPDLSDTELTEKNLKKLSAQSKKKGLSSEKIVKEASKEMQDFLTLSEQEKETDRILNEFLAQNARLQTKESKNLTNPGITNKIDSSVQKPINTNPPLKEVTGGKAKENELPVTTSQTGRTTMSAATNATFSSLNFTPLSTASSQQKPMSVTGKNMEDYMRNMRTNVEIEHAGLYAGLTGIEDNRDLETQVADILQSVSDITKSIESSGDFVNAPIVPTIGTNNKSLAKKANEDKTKPLNSAALAEENKQKRAEEEQQIANLNEFLQSATMSVDEARVAVASGQHSHVRFNVDDDKDKGISSKNGTKSVPLKPSPEEELRQLVQKTVKSTAEVTKASAQQGQVASATRELQNVVMRSSIDMSADTNVHANSTKTQPSTNKTVGANASAFAQGSHKATKPQPVTNNTSVASTSKKSANTNTNATSKAQQMVEAYTGAPDAISGNTSHTNTKAPSQSSNNIQSTATTSKPTVNASPTGGGGGSVGGDGKYWWDISVGNSVEGASPAAGGITTGGTNANTGKASSGNNHNNSSSNANSKPSAAAIGNDLKGGDSMGDSLKLGGELDN